MSTHRIPLRVLGGAIAATATGAAIAVGAAASPIGAGAHAASAATVTIRSFAYRPVTLTVRPGVRITFVNHDATNHSVTANRGAFDLSTVGAGRSGTIRLTRPGTYAYHCVFHPFMHGTIVVR